MPILRHEHKTNYTVIPNDLLRDGKLSLRDRGLLCVMLSLPDGWEFSVRGLEAIFPHDGLNGICVSLKNIESAGYLIRERQRDKSGKLGHVIWTVMDVPKPCHGKPDMDKPNKEKPDMEKPCMGNPSQLNKDSKKVKTDKVTTKERSIAPTLDEVRAYCTERNSLVDPQTFFDYFEAGGWKDSEGKPVRSWKQKLITWEKHEKEKQYGHGKSGAAGGLSEAIRADGKKPRFEFEYD